MHPSLAERCVCGSGKDAWFSRVEPMGYFCPECGKERLTTEEYLLKVISTLSDRNALTAKRLEEASENISEMKHEIEKFKQDIEKLKRPVTVEELIKCLEQIKKGSDALAWIASKS